MKRKALLAGISFYDRLDNLPSSSENAKKFAKVLTEYGDFQVRICPKQSIQGKTVYLKNLEDVTQPQTKKEQTYGVSFAELKGALLNLFKPKGEINSDTALFYFSGHGYSSGHSSQTSKWDSELYLATSDANPEHTKWGVSFQWLLHLMKESDVRRQIVVLDCCYSGVFSNFSEPKIANFHRKSYFMSLALGLADRDTLDAVKSRYLKEFAAASEIVDISEIKRHINEKIIVFLKDDSSKIKCYYFIETLAQQSNYSPIELRLDIRPLLSEMFYKDFDKLKRKILSANVNYRPDISYLYRHFFSEISTNNIIEKGFCEFLHMLTPEHSSLAKEYYSLLSLIELSKLEEERLSEIIELAQSDNVLSFLYNEINYLILQEQGLLNDKDIEEYRIKNTKLAEIISASVQLEEQELSSEYIEKGSLRFITKISHLLKPDKEHLPKLKEDLPQSDHFFTTKLCSDVLWKFIPERIDLLKEYYNLLSASRLSEAEENRLSEIFELAQSDSILSFFCNEIDFLILEEQGVLDDENVQVGNKKRTKIAEFLDERLEEQESVFELIEKTSLKFISKLLNLLKLDTQNVALLSDLSTTELTRFSYKLLLKIIPECTGLLKEYYNLLSASKLSEAEENRLSEIFELAQSDSILSFFCNEIDFLILEEQGVLDDEDVQVGNKKRTKIAELLDERLEEYESIFGLIEKCSLMFIAKVSDLLKFSAEMVEQLSCFSTNELKKFSYKLLLKFIPERTGLLKEYYNLLSASKLSEAEENRLSEILELAQSDSILSFFCNEIDSFVLQEDAV